MGVREVRQYYSGMKHFYGVYDEVGRKNPFHTESRLEFENWQTSARRELHEILGLNLFPACPAQPELLDTWELDGLRIERVAISTYPGIRVPLTVILPDKKNASGKSPVWLHTFGHGGKNQMVDSFKPRDPSDPLSKLLKSQTLGPGGLIALAHKGYIGIAFDSFGSGERYFVDEIPRDVMDIGADNPINNVAVALGTCILGIEVMELMRVADYALSREDCDGRIGVMGTSGGGHESLFFGAADPRVCATATSVWFYGFKESHIGLPHNCSCNYVPGLFPKFDCQDIGALVAPRALHVDAGIRDYLNGRKTGLGNMLIPYYDTQRAFSLYGKEDLLSLNVFDGGHGCPTWNCEDEQTLRSGDGLLQFATLAMPLEEGAHE